jgi:hypothetical protein
MWRNPLFAFAAMSLILLPDLVFAQKVQMKTQQDILYWMQEYRKNPEPAKLAAAVHRMREIGLFEDQDNAGLFIGFIAGVLGSDRTRAEGHIKKMFPMPPKEQGVIIRAIAYSALPNWKEILNRFASRMPERKTLIEAYLYKGEKTLIDIELQKGPFVIDALWGYYFATGDYRPVARIISALQWSKETGDLDKLMVAGLAKWTLAANAERSRDLIEFYRFMLDRQDRKVKPQLQEVVDAAENFEATRLRKQTLAAVEERRAKGAKSSWGFASELGSTTLSIGCVIASAAGQPQIAAPCVVAGALYSGAVHLIKKANE